MAELADISFVELGVWKVGAVCGGGSWIKVDGCRDAHACIA
jgi:hypothetical protein